MSILPRAGRLFIAILLLALTLLPQPSAAPSTGKTIRFIAQADLRSIDPIWTTAYITRNYGYMVYDTLLATDEHFKVQPQMVDKWTVSEDGLVYAFTLRPGLKWHDGTPVTAPDCIASLDRWMKRDVLGQALPAVIGEMKAVDAAIFTVTLKKPFALFLDALAKISSNTPFMM